MTPAHMKALREGQARHAAEKRREGIALAKAEVEWLKLDRVRTVLKRSQFSDADEVRLANTIAELREVSAFINGRKATQTDYENAYEDGELTRPFTS